jgi:NADP-dependent 3-hydroxy acid dehydrogenase YdfG
MPPTIVITGVSTGIGHAAAAAFLARGYNVFGTVRQPEEARALTQAWGASFRALLVDVTDV